MGIASPNARSSWGVITPPSIGVSVGPGAIALALTPCLAWSTLIALVSIATPPLDAT